MRHRNAGRTLGRNASHRLALMRNLTRSLIEHGRIITTLEKAKEVRPFVEKLITLAKQNTLHARRLALSRLRDKAAVAALFAEIAPRFADRPGGYTRVVKRHERRLGDAGRTAFLELLKEGEKKVRVRQPQAPRVEAPAAPASPPAAAPEPAPASEAAQTPPETPPTETPPAS
jgi:large subunit ribosomal protein L17